MIRFNSKDYSTRGWSPENSFCHWDITVSPGRKIKVFFSEFDFYPSGEGTACTEKYLMVHCLDIGKFETILAKNRNDNANFGFQLRDGGSEDSPLLGDDVHCTFPDTIPLTTSNRLYIKAKTAHQGTVCVGETSLLLLLKFFIFWSSGAFCQDNSPHLKLCRVS